jgi:hypothetical protein
MEQQQQKNKLYIPYNLKLEREYFSGFGGKELRESAIGAVIGIIIAAFVYLFTGALPLLMLIVIIGIFASGMITVKDQNNISVLTQLRNIINFSKKQQSFKYIFKFFGDE